MLPVGTRIEPGRPDYCRRCDTVTRHSFYVASHEWWCPRGEWIRSEACGYSCDVCGEEGNAFQTLLSMLAAAGCEPRPEEGAA